MLCVSFHISVTSQYSPGNCKGGMYPTSHQAKRSILLWDHTNQDSCVAGAKKYLGPVGILLSERSRCLAINSTLQRRPSETKYSDF